MASIRCIRLWNSVPYSICLTERVGLFRVSVMGALESRRQILDASRHHKIFIGNCFFNYTKD